MNTKTIYIAPRITKEYGKYCVDYRVEKEDGEIEERTNTFDSLRDAGIYKSELKIYFNRSIPPSNIIN